MATPARTQARRQRPSFLTRVGTSTIEEGRALLRSVAFLGESLDVARTIGHPWLVSEALSEWGELLWQQQHVDKASARFQEALAIARKIQVHELVATALYGLARIAAAHGDRAAGRQQGQESLDAYAAMGHARAREVSQWLATVL